MGYYKYQVGDYVIIPPREGHEDEYPFTYTEPMLEAEGEIYQIVEIVDCSTFPHILDLPFSNGDTNKYVLKRCPYTSKDTSFDPHSYWWHSSMFVPYSPSTSKVDALETTTIYPIDMKVGDKVYACGNEGEISKSSKDNYFVFFDAPAHAIVCEKLRANSKIHFSELSAQLGGKEGVFPEFRAMPALIAFINELNKRWAKTSSIPEEAVSKQSELITSKLSKNEIRFQKPQASIRRGSVPKGSTIYGRQHKIAIRVSPLADQVIFG